MRSNTLASRVIGPGPAALALLESSSVVGCLLVAPDGAIRWANALARRWLTGRDDGDFESPRLNRWLPQPDDQRRLQTAFNRDGLTGIELELGLASGDCLPIAGDFVPLAASTGEACLAGIFRDATAGRQLRAGMERSARLEALGSLTSGIAHDFNNLLTILVGNIALVAEDLRHDSKQFARLKSARDAANRGGELIRQLLSFARQEPVATELINPSKVIAGVAPLIQVALGRAVKVELDLDETLDPIEGNSAQLESVIVNLAVNARDAIKDNGCVQIRVGASVADAMSKSLRIEVVDDGCGIASEILDTVFEPFFTTKGQGQGSGLGLSMVKAYADRFGGTVEVISRQGSGTCVRLSFPCSADSMDDSAAMTMPLASLPSGSEFLLLLSAEDYLSSMMEQILKVLGYRIRIAADLDVARQILASCKPDLLISDGVDVGPLLELQRATDKTGPRVLLLRSMGAGDSGESVPVLHKPFSLPDLALAVRETLDED